VPTSGLFLRALLAFVALPGVVAIAIPATWIAARHGLRPTLPAGLLLLGLGFLLLLSCVRDFYVAGKGTLAPWAPPRHLVDVGLYRYSRNPMYVAVLLMLLGWAIGFTSMGLFLYAAGVGVAFQLRVVFGEEPWLARTHGQAWEDYAQRVPRWLW